MKANRIAGMIGNILEHYDNALFGFLAPFIAPLFFQNSDPITALILTYGMLPLGFLTRPIGALFFGFIGDRYGRKYSLFCSLSGMAIVTMSIGILPVYREIGVWAPLLLALGRMLQSFCAAGETTGGALFVLESTSRSKRGLTSSFYDASSIGGILLASGLVTLLSYQGSIEQNWRILFWIGGMTAILGIFIRWKTKESIEFVKPKKSLRVLSILKEHRTAFIAIILASGFSYTTYSLAFTLMNGYIPLITSFSKTQVMQVNTLLLIIDMTLLPCFGYLANKLGKERVMLMGALCSAIGALPLFYLLNQASLALVILIRFAIIVGGVAFAAPYYAWAMERVPATHRYVILSLGGSLGSQLIGMPTSSICLWLFKTTGWTAAPGLYLMISGFAASYMIYHFAREEGFSLFPKRG